jgi:hypothetical protein
LDVVHKKTVTRRSVIPSVLLATPPSPIFDRHPDFVVLRFDRSVDVKDELRSPALSERDRRNGVGSVASSTGSRGSEGAM